MLEKAMQRDHKLLYISIKPNAGGGLVLGSNGLYETINKPRGVRTRRYRRVPLLAHTNLQVSLLYRPRDHHNTPTYRQPEYPGVLLFFSRRVHETVAKSSACRSRSHSPSIIGLRLGKRPSMTCDMKDTCKADPSNPASRVRNAALQGLA
ncbi:hypothetical protein TRIATDRAFT_298803 [Trichoderma atroviride IMI 206040]|uniref:Uncharacterized protein n=1 Tax=Hypocrea atroviridis (strain ATCC 20476 / IMI 206040) TaxID=452589 RepID=G9NQV6_HYPAI|nr:uncharacterized protein TRIATDRAFT_298803 [Trichoderma atroviride IMI 206040]EHK46926.1 hypothetical protein TRIATDRAFT_298803 [Trichoderma atroviride IMI 206040]